MFKVNLHPFPSLSSLIYLTHLHSFFSGWLRSTRLSEQARRRHNFQDRTSQLHLDSTITISERESLSLHFLGKKNGKRCHSFGMRFAWIGAFSQMLRGESIRTLELADLLMKDYEPLNRGEGVGVNKMLICVLGGGKTHRDGQAQFGAYYRHKDPLLCPIGSLALYFFKRFQISEDEEDGFPDLTDPKEFFNVKVSC